MHTKTQPAHRLVKMNHNAVSIPSISVNGVIVPVLNEPIGNLGAVSEHEYVGTCIKSYEVCK